MEEASHTDGQCVMSIQNATKLSSVIETLRIQNEAITALQTRLPVWATLVFSLLTFMLGTVSGALYFALNYLRV